MKPHKLLLFAAVFLVFSAHAKTEKFGTWIELEFRKDFLKRFAFSITPELRLQDQFNPDEYLVQAKLTADPFSFLSLAGAYRVGTEIKNKGNEKYHRYAFDATFSQKFGRFEGSLRGRVTNYTDSSEDDPGTFIRSRTKLEYDLKGKKIKPFVSYELFHNATKNELHKGRFDFGFSRNLKGPHRIGLYYRLQNYFKGKPSIHILGMEYRLKI